VRGGLPVPWPDDLLTLKRLQGLALAMRQPCGWANACPTAETGEPMLARLIIAALFVLGPLVALAQDHDHSHQGGLEKKLGPYQVELVVKGSDVMLYIQDDKDRKIESAPFTATALVLAKSNEQKTIQFAPAGDNKLAGKFNFTVEGKFRAAVTLKNGATEVGKARYVLDIKR